MTITEKEIAAGLRPAHYEDLSAQLWEPRTDTAKRVKWSNTLRAIVARRMPRNKLGVPMVSDVDLLLATEEEREEALEITFKKK